MSGFQFLRSQSGGEVCGTLETVDIPASVSPIIAIGDVIRLAGSSNATGVATATNIVVASPSTSTQVLGVVNGFELDPFNLDAGAPPGGTDRVARVDVEPLNLYQVDCDGTLSAAQVGLNAQINGIAPDASNGNFVFSSQTLHTATVATTVTFPLTIVALLEDDDGVLGNRALVRLSNTSNSAAVAGV